MGAFAQMRVLFLTTLAAAESAKTTNQGTNQILYRQSFLSSLYTELSSVWEGGRIEEEKNIKAEGRFLA